MARAASYTQGDYRILWASQLFQQGHEQAARSQLERAEHAYNLAPPMSVTYYNLGVAYQQLGDRQKARTLLERFISLEPNGPGADVARQLLAQLAR